MLKEFRMSDEPFVTAVTNVLHEVGVDQQAYHSRTLIGNHIHKCCQASKYNYHCCC